MDQQDNNALPSEQNATASQLPPDWFTEIQQLRQQIATVMQHQASREAQPGAPYDGDKTTFTAWKILMAHKLVTDRKFIGTDKDQWMFVWQCLAPKIQSRVTAFFEAGPSYQYNPLQFLAYLESVFANPHRIEIAQTELEQLEQASNKAFTSFYVRFEQKLALAGGINWPDEIKLVKLRRALNKTIRDSSIGRNIPRDSYKAAVNIYRSIAVDIESYRLEEKYRNRYGRAIAPTKPITDEDGNVRITGINAATVGRRRPVTQGTRTSLGQSLS
ncbi:hypothetical protein DCS_03730 [Drechmeria coniospora]|uniref:Uncharacterized protein n=1 Tax=Drechmeria coniospora TaxID=98403 RepID=A0A151GHZ7_DRECN|nr:hypothetical protein DCS_03730 [Drechmeria coniospora]KYK56724.1 hypothetical protein DCS_03730 [Drechmeria coniospora]